MNHLASRLLILRGLGGGISQRELAQLARISPAYPGFLERQPDDPGVGAEIAMRIAGVFGCSVSYLVRGEGKPPSEKQARAAVEAARAALKAAGDAA